MAADADDSVESYVEKLYQVFISCDTSGRGFLGNDELTALCDKLQLDDQQTNFVLNQLVCDDPFAQVRYKNRESSFVTAWPASFDSILGLLIVLLFSNYMYVRYC